MIKLGLQSQAHCKTVLLLNTDDDRLLHLLQFYLIHTFRSTDNKANIARQGGE